MIRNVPSELVAAALATSNAPRTPPQFVWPTTTTRRSRLAYKLRNSATRIARTVFDAKDTDGIRKHSVSRVVGQVKLAAQASSVNDDQSLRAIGNVLCDVAVHKDVPRFAPHDNALRYSRVSTTYPKDLFDDVEYGESAYMWPPQTDLGALPFGALDEELGVSGADIVCPLSVGRQETSKIWHEFSGGDHCVRHEGGSGAVSRRLGEDGGRRRRREYIL